MTAHTGDIGFKLYTNTVQDPVAQHQKLAKLARLAIRRLGTQRLKQTPAENSEVLAKSNAVILRYHCSSAFLPLLRQVL